MALDPSDSRPVYQQIADDLRRWIASDDVQVGDVLPSLTELAKRYGRASQTIRNGIAVLEDEGLVVTRQGEGMFVLTKPNSTDPQATQSPKTATDILLELTRQNADTLTELSRRMDSFERVLEKALGEVRPPRLPPE